MSKSRCLLALVFLGSIALAPAASWADAVHDGPRIPIHPRRPIHPDIPSICDAVAGNLVKNCGFETGNFSDWTVSGGGHLIASEAFAHSGSFVAGFIGSTQGTISQAFSTMPGLDFHLSFFLAQGTQNHPGIDRSFSVSWDGTRIFSVPTTEFFPYTQFSFVVPGTGHDTLQFAGHSSLSDPYFVDDVVATPVPEPGTLSLFGLGLLLGGALLARRKKLLDGVQA